MKLMQLCEVIHLLATSLGEMLKCSQSDNHQATLHLHLEFMSSLLPAVYESAYQSDCDTFF